MAIAACAAGMLALIVTVARVSKPARSDSGGESVEPMSSAATAPGSTPETAPEALTGQSADTIPFTDAPEVADYDLLPVRPTNLPASVPRDGDWGAHVESMLGLDIPMKVNPAVLGLPVWTIQHSGYYYCAENLNSEAPQSGALMMQGEALQSGYQPKLGSYCH
jgi:hypothetical protein